MKIALASIVPLYPPAACWAGGCECQWLCAAVSTGGCVAIAGLAVASIFLALSFFGAFRGLDALHD